MTDVGAVDSYGEIGRGELVKRLGRGFAGKEEGGVSLIFARGLHKNVLCFPTLGEGLCQMFLHGLILMGSMRGSMCQNKDFLSSEINQNIVHTPV